MKPRERSLLLRPPELVLYMPQLDLGHRRRVFDLFLTREPFNMSAFIRRFITGGADCTGASSIRLSSANFSGASSLNVLEKVSNREKSRDQSIE